jgi:glutaconate CoA-transferase subunit A
VVELPFSAHPTSVYRRYDYDAGQIQRYVEATRTPEEFQAYLDQVVFGVQDHAGYLELVGGKAHLDELRADPLLGY